MRTWACAGLLIGAAAQARPPIERSIHIDAPPEVLYELLADLEAWGEWTAVAADDGPFVAVRGEPYEREQSLRWSGGGLGAGRIRITDVHEDHLGFELVRTAPAGFGVDTWTRWRQSTRLHWWEEDGGTELVWSTVPHNFTARGKNVAETVEVALRELAQAAEAAPPHPESQRTRVSEAEALAVWRGFEQEWTYNHRINRVGSWVGGAECGPQGCEAELGHAAASGSGADQAHVVDHADLVQAPDLRVLHGSSTLWFSGREGETLTDEDCTALSEAAAGGTFLLAGFDLAAVRSPHSLWSLGLRVTHEQVEGVEVLCVSGSLQMACRTAECRRDRWTEYVMEVSWTHAAAPGLSATRHVAPRIEYEWEDGDLRDMLRAEDFRWPHTLQGQPGLEAATVGFASIELALSAPLHTRSLVLAVEPRGYDAELGALDLELGLFYQQWGPVEIAPFTVAQLSKPGHAALGAELVLIQLEQACITPVVQRGHTFWPGGRLGSGAEEAELRTVEAFPECGVGSPEEGGD